MSEAKTMAPPIIVDITDFLDGGILREKAFREKLARMDWEAFRDKKVIIKGCDRVPVPTWAYLMLVAHLAPYAKRLFWGEPCSAVPIYVRKD